MDETPAAYLAVLRVLQPRFKTSHLQVDRSSASLRAEWLVMWCRTNKNPPRHTPCFVWALWPVADPARVPAMPRGHRPRWLTESGRPAATCHPNLLRLLWWDLTQRCPCHYCGKKTEVKNCDCSTAGNQIKWHLLLRFGITSHLIVQMMCPSSCSP